MGDSVPSNDIIRMKKQRLDNAYNTITGHLNINSFKNKFVFIEDLMKLFDMFLVSESKLDHTFRVTNLGSTVTKLLDLTVIVLVVD